MKTVNLSATGRKHSLAWLLSGAVLCLAATGAHAQNDPSGTWDFVVSGSQQGVAFLTFNKDFTLSGFEVITSYTPPPSPEGRDGTDTGRVPSSGGVSNQFLIGFGPV